MRRAILTLVLGRSLTPLTITSVIPKTGSPAQKISAQNFEATTITIRGSGFTDTTKVTFEGVEGKISSRSSRLLLVKVPKGAKTGKLRVFNGKCNAGEDLSATSSCKSTTFYVDCYSALKGLHGGEINVKLNTYQAIDYDIPATKAFRSVLVRENSLTNNQKANYKISISCNTYSNVRMHNQSCEPTNSNNKLSHEFNISTSYTPQYYITAGRGTCTVNLGS